MCNVDKSDHQCSKLSFLKSDFHNLIAMVGQQIVWASCYNLLYGHGSYGSMICR